MTECSLDSSVPDWIIEHPETERVFRDAGIDTSCGGKSLEYVCRERGFDPQWMLSKLQLAIDRGNEVSP